MSTTRAPRITVELRRPARRSVALVLGASLLLTPTAVLASHQFHDVPLDHPFHSEIDAIAKAGITAGFRDGGYHPNDPVTRQAMAAFMQRGFGRVAMAAWSAPKTELVTVAANSRSSATYASVRDLTITVPGANNGFSPEQLVYVQGRVVFETQMTSSLQGCPCLFEAAIGEPGGAYGSNIAAASHKQTFEQASFYTYTHTIDVEALFTASPGPHTYELYVELDWRETPTNEAWFRLHQSSSLSAMTFPFGNTP